MTLTESRYMGIDDKKYKEVSKTYYVLLAEWQKYKGWRK